MKRTLSILSLYVAVSIAAFGQIAPASHSQANSCCDCCPACCTSGTCSDDCCAKAGCTDDCCSK